MEFAVTVVTHGSESHHGVTLSSPDCDRLTNGNGSPETLVEAAFAFLLDREPKESILDRFDLTVIERYFPEFERELPNYLERLKNPPPGERA
jgi:hypothetical protein